VSVRKHRRAVFAELLLLADPIGFSAQGDGISLTIDFATAADLRSWLHLADLNSPCLLITEHERTDHNGRAYRSLHAYPTWHGWDIYASAVEYPDTSPLDPPTLDQLGALAASGGTD
jgi:hypothetical protein